MQVQLDTPRAAELPCASSSLRISTDASALEAVLEPGIASCLWRRPLPGAAAAELRGLASAPLDVAMELDAQADAWPLPDVLGAGAARARIEADVARLVPVFARLSGRRHLKLRLSRVEDNACRKFHVDFVGLRLLVTYAGPGTELVDHAHVHREHIGRHELTMDEANALIVPDPTHIVRAEPGDVALLKGEAWRGNGGRGAVHRSPPIEGTRTSRLVLKLDALACGC
jgi:hypothetical protein